MGLINLIGLSFLFVVNVGYAGIDKCIPADKVSREFTLAAVKGDFETAWKLVSPQSPQGKKKDHFIKEVQRQFRRLMNKEVLHSVSTFGLEQASCHIDHDKVTKFHDSRLLLHFDLSKGNGVAEVLPMSVDVHLTKGNIWQVYRFASTAL